MRREVLLVASRGDAERSCSKTMSPARRALYGGGFASRRARGSSCARRDVFTSAPEPVVAAVENSVPAIAPPPPVPAPAPAPVTASGATEEAVRSILSPLLKELISSVAVAGQIGLGLGLGMGFWGVGLADMLGLGFGVAGPNPGVPSDEKWRQQQILELEVYLKRIELVREHVKAALEELRSSER